MLTVQEAGLGVARSPDRMECADEAERGEDVSLPFARKLAPGFSCTTPRIPKRVDLSWDL
jgi:hypothetical protein